MIIKINKLVLCSHEYVYENMQKQRKKYDEFDFHLKNLFHIWEQKLDLYTLFWTLTSKIHIE